MEEKILKLAKDLSGAGEAREETLKLLCAQAAEELAGRLREGLSAEDCGSAFPVAAAWLALSLLRGGESAEGVESFSAGDLTIRRAEGGAALEDAAGLRRQAEEVMGPYLRDRAFSFRGVPG